MMNAFVSLVLSGLIQWNSTPDCTATPAPLTSNTKSYGALATTRASSEAWGADLLDAAVPLPNAIKMATIGATYRFGMLRIKLEGTKLSDDRRHAEIHWHVCNDQSSLLGLQNFQVRAADRMGGLLPVYKGWFNVETRASVVQILPQARVMLTTRVDFPSEAGAGGEIREVSLGRIYLVAPDTALWFHASRLLK
jgi:hypothetical protein